MKEILEYQFGINFWIKTIFVTKISDRQHSNLGFIGNNCNETCPENCKSSWNVWVSEDYSNITAETSQIDEKIIVSCGKITDYNIFTSFICHISFIMFLPMRHIYERY